MKPKIHGLGNLRRITNDLNHYTEISTTGNTGALVTVQEDTTANLWVADVDRRGEPRQITSGAARRDGRYGIAWLPNGRIIHTSEASGALELWSTAPDGTGLRQLTKDGGEAQTPRPCGNGAAFTSGRTTGLPHIWRIDPDGANLKQLTREAGETTADCSPDGKWVAYMPMKFNNPTIWKVPVEGGTPVSLSEYGAAYPVFSPDGKMLAYVYIAETDKHGVAVAPADGGKPVHYLDLPASPVRWNLDGTALFFEKTENHVSNIWLQPIAGGPPRQITDFKTDLIFSFDVSPDRRHLVMSRGASNYDVVLLRDKK